MVLPEPRMSASARVKVPLPAPRSAQTPGSAATALARKSRASREFMPEVTRRRGAIADLSRDRWTETFARSLDGDVRRRFSKGLEDEQSPGGHPGALFTYVVRLYHHATLLT